MSKILIKRLPGTFRSWSEAQAICTQRNKTARHYAYVSEKNRTGPGYYVIGIPKSKITKAKGGKR